MNLKEQVKKCVELKFQCQQISEKVDSASQFTEEQIDDIRKKIHSSLEDVLVLLRRK